jgi:DNA repair protein SbcD/Mre11
VIIVHAADIHLDSPLVGLTRYEGAPVGRIRGATRRALENLVDLSIERQAALLVIAGDLYDGNWKDYATGLFFSKQMSRLRDAGVEVVMVRGNHDAASQLTRSLRLPSNVRDLSTSEPETVVYESIGVACHGQGYAQRAVTHDLAASYPPPIAGLLNLGVLHTALSGREGHEPYAPTSVAALAARGYDYWALGHVHTREVLSEAPWIVFPGNLQGRHVREAGPKGATVVEVVDGRITSVTHVALDTVRFATLRIDVSEQASADEALDLVQEALERGLEGADGRLLCARVELVGTGPAAAALARDPTRWESEIRALAIDVGGDECWLERVDGRGLSIVDDAWKSADTDLVAELLAAISKARAAPAELSELRESVRHLTSKLPAEIDRVDPSLRLLDDAAVRSLLDDVERLLLVRLSGSDPSAGRPDR